MSRGHRPMRCIKLLRPVANLYLGRVLRAFGRHLLRRRPVLRAVRGLRGRRHQMRAQGRGQMPDRPDLRARHDLFGFRRLRAASETRADPSPKPALQGRTGLSGGDPVPARGRVQPRRLVPVRRDRITMQAGLQMLGRTGLRAAAGGRLRARCMVQAGRDLPARGRLHPLRLRRRAVLPPARALSISGAIA